MVGDFTVERFEDMSEDAANDEGLLSRIVALRVEHEDLGAAIEALSGKANPDQLQLARLKKKKLALRDEIARLSERITPDIIA